jgi:hypothetical protein
MASEIPVVRYFLACLEVIIEPGGVGVTLRQLIHNIARLPGEPFPCVREHMALYALLTNGRGEHDFGRELAFFEQGEEQSLRRTGTRRVDLGQYPTMVHGLPLTLRNVTFARAGQYVFSLLCDGHRIGRVEIDVR